MCNDSGTSVGQSIDYQQVYSASAFSGPLTITSISFLFAPQFGGSSLILSGNYTIDLAYAANGAGALSSVLGSNIVGGSESLFASASSNGTDSANPTATINGQTPFNYNPANGDLLLEIIASDQSNVPNGSGNGYFQADNTGLETSRAVCVTSQGCYADNTGLVTEFNLVTTDVPEPATLALFGMGIAGLAAIRSRRKPAKAMRGA